jgi:hypothetical protein
VGTKEIRFIGDESDFFVKHVQTLSLKTCGMKKSELFAKKKRILCLGKITILVLEKIQSWAIVQTLSLKTCGMKKSELFAKKRILCLSKITFLVLEKIQSWAIVQTLSLKTCGMKKSEFYVFYFYLLIVCQDESLSILLL